METAMGTDFGLGQGAGFSQTARYRIALTGPTGYTVNYADDQPDRKRGRFAPCMLYLARRFGTPGAAAFAHRQIDTFLRENAEAVYPLDLVWYVPAEAQDDAAPPLDYYLRGRVPVVSMRSAHEDPNALWVAVKGGEQPVNHGHLDLGTFELQALGRRWAVDLGRDDYNLPGWWDARPGGKRWSYFRVGSRSHNVPLIDDANQKVPAASRILEVESGDEPCVEIDLTDAYAPKADQVLRRIELQDARASVRIADTIRLNTSADLAWGMTTPAEITLSADGRSAMMTIGDDALQATLSSPAQARFSVESAEREAPEQRNVGMKRLMARVADCAPGKHAFIVTLRPQE
jgi:hypothetical protein